MYNSNHKNVNTALTYINNKWYVYPVWGIDPLTLRCYCGSADCRAGKHPYGKAVPHGSNDATIDPSLIAKWFVGEGVNVGIDTTQSNLLVIDFDKKHGGMETLKRWEAEHGAMPLTPCVSSGGGGRHYYFRKHPAIVSNATTLKPLGIDVITSGAVIAPPSLHESGKRYEWLTPCTTPLADCPAWLVDLILREQEQDDEPQDVIIDPMRGRLTQTGTTFDEAGNVPAGQRNAVVLRIIGSMLNAGYTQEQILTQGTAWAERQSPPYSLNDLRERVKSLSKKDKAKGVLLGVGVREVFDALDAGATVTPYVPATTKEVSSQDDLTSFVEAPADDQSEDASFVANVSPQQNTPPPVSRLNVEAISGLFADYVKAVAEHTEADPAGVLLSVMTAFGSAVGRRPNIAAGRRHRANLFVLLCGDTAARKGTAWDVGSKPIVLADVEWAKRINYGFGSGEGLIYAVRDDAVKNEAVKEKGAIVGYSQIVVPGINDKRLLIVEEEFDKVLRLCRKENSLLSPILRSAWDGSPLQTMNKSENADACREPHASTLSCSTPQEFKSLTHGRAEMFNGFINRFLILIVRRSGSLPFGGAWEEVAEGFAMRFQQAIETAKQIDRLAWSEEAKALWVGQYDRLSLNSHAVVARAADHTLRLALLFAIADGSKTIRAEHLQSALTIYDYCHASTLELFGQQAQPQAEESLTEKMLRLITASGSNGMSKSEITDAFNRRLPAAERDTALQSLLVNCLIVMRWKRTGGRTAERYYGKGGVGSADDQPQECATKEERTPPQGNLLLSSQGVQADEPQAVEAVAIVETTPHPVTQISDTAVRGML